MSEQTLLKLFLVPHRWLLTVKTGAAEVDIEGEGKKGGAGSAGWAEWTGECVLNVFFFWRKIFLFLCEDLSTLVTKGRGGALWVDISWLGKFCRLETNFALKGLVDSQTITFCRGKTSSSTSACIAIVSSIVSLTCCRNGMIFHVICNQRWTSSPSHAMPGQHSCAIDPDWQSQIKPYEIQFSESLPSAHRPTRHGRSTVCWFPQAAVIMSFGNMFR